MGARRAAANGEHPEEGGRQRKSRSHPNSHHEALVELALGIVLARHGLDGADDNDRDTGGQGGETAHGYGRDAGDQPRKTRDDARAVGKDAKDDFDHERNEGDDEDDLGPLAGRDVRLERVRDLLGQGNVLAREGKQRVDVMLRAVQRILGPVELGLGALARAVVGRGAVAPEGDVVDVVEAEEGRRQVGEAAIGIIALGQVVDSDRLDVTAKNLLRAGLEDGGLVQVQEVAGVGEGDGEIGKVDVEHVHGLVGDAC